ncbi:MAG: hypothetical protein QOD75_2221 [Blastocatellia bacterium]|jgi:hypothetical protein|nr:hypothetical protein [Blastocatellia bacterium]
MKTRPGFPIRFAALLAAALLLLFSMAACKHSPENGEATDNSSYHPTPTPGTEFEQKMKLVRDAHFAHVWIFERNDGKAFTPEDSKILHSNAPRVVDWVGMDDKKKFIAGSNFDIEPEQMAALRKRYKISDYTGQ